MARFASLAGIPAFDCGDLAARNRNVGHHVDARIGIDHVAPA